ncbi:hypothetical protein G6F37_008935 [Rhizopus arrhizus]|nr:hypothetical protein G6F38_010093 [Rhizopus arrhizus]KAG1155006.1 hypothetical protein G6F37_008935 [Rhizopus arrhizus]
MSLVSYYKHWTSFLYLTLRYPTIRIYTKTPSIIAGNELSGTIMIEYPSNLFGITVTMIVCQHKHIFLKDTILRIDSLDMQKRSTRTIPFQYRLHHLFSGTYKKQRGGKSIKYHIQCELWYIRLGKIEYVKIKKPITVYSNVSRWLREEQALSFLFNDRQVLIDVCLPQRVWISDNTAISIHLFIQNNHLRQHLNEVKLKLIRQIGNRIKIIATNSSREWWQPLMPRGQDELIMTIQPPPNEFSIDQQKELNVSFFVQVFVCFQNEILVANLPILLVHPMSASSIHPSSTHASLLTQPPTLAITQKTLSGRIKHGLTGWMNLSLASVGSEASTIQNVASFASEKVEIPSE